MPVSPQSPRAQLRTSSMPSPPLAAQHQQACEATSPRLKRSRQPTADTLEGDGGIGVPASETACLLRVPVHAVAAGKAAHVAVTRSDATVM